MDSIRIIHSYTYDSALLCLLGPSHSPELLWTTGAVMDERYGNNTICFIHYGLTFHSVLAESLLHTTCHCDFTLSPALVFFVGSREFGA
ncbi:hypothetical protein J6590_066287 [Homalodisca vitripennis]|nr:hypothetical protein J6590_066287 [Homalodisca vitripennis]